jgi:FkbM family methyltransferase
MQDGVKKAIASAVKHFELFGTRGVLRRALISIPGVNTEFRAPIPNSPHSVILRLGTSDVAAFEHVFVHQEYDISVVGAPSIIVDAGANIGMSAVYFSLRYPSAQVLAVEPDPANFAVLRKNAVLFPNILPVNAALWNRETMVTMVDAGGGSWGLRVRESNSAHPGHISVRAVTLQALFEEYRITGVDLLKIDIEGAEREILEDASQWIHQVSVICAELHDRFRSGCSEAFETATARFPLRWRRGELSCVAREGTILLQ